MDRSIRDMTVASVLFFFMGLGVKLLPRLPVSEIVLFRALIALGLGFFMIRSRGLSLFGTQKKLLVLRGIFGTFSLIGFFHSLHALPMATAVTVQQLSPIFATLLAVLVLKDKVAPVQWAYFFAALFGVVLVNGFEFSADSLNVLIGVGSALSAAVAYTSISMIKNKEHPLTIIFYFPLITVPVILPFAIRDWIFPRFHEWVLLLLIGICVQGAQYYMTMSYQNGSTAKVSIVTYLGVVLSVISGYLFFAESLDGLTLSGIALIIIAVILNTFHKNAAPAESR
jgi:drug/metabolite transporter (DMT)-like permease